MHPTPSWVRYPKENDNLNFYFINFSFEQKNVMNVVNQLLELVTLWMRKIIVKSIIVQNAIVVQNVENKLLDTWLGRIPRHFIPVKYIYFFREINFTKISYYFWRVPMHVCILQLWLVKLCKLNLISCFFQYAAYFILYGKRGKICSRRLGAIKR